MIGQGENVANPGRSTANAQCETSAFDKYFILIPALEPDAQIYLQRPTLRGYGFSTTVSGFPISLTTTIRILAGSVLLALLDTAWSWPGAS